MSSDDHPTTDHPSLPPKPNLKLRRLDADITRSELLDTLEQIKGRLPETLRTIRTVAIGLGSAAALITLAVLIAPTNKDVTREVGRRG